MESMPAVQEAGVCLHSGLCGLQLCSVLPWGFGGSWNCLWLTRIERNCSAQQIPHLSSLVVLFLRQGLMCSSGWPQTRSVAEKDNADFLSDPPASTSRVLKLQMYTTTLSLYHVRDETQDFVYARHHATK